MAASGAKHAVNFSKIFTNRCSYRGCMSMQIQHKLNVLLRTYSTSSNAIEKTKQSTFDDDEFRVLVIPGHTKVSDEKKDKSSMRKSVPPARYKTMKLDQEWTDVWPTAHTFKWSAVPFPVRQGMVEREENDGIVPGKYANAELMKIPNFLHLTPNHVKKHCAAIKQFCTPWPEGLETEEQCEKHFPIEVTTCDYVLDGPSLRDPRARGVTLKVKLSSLDLDYHARDKILRLVGDRYDPKTDILTLHANRCPLRKQNYDYVQYLLTALYFEAWKTEPWEEEKTRDDMEKFVWDIMPSRESVVSTVKKMKEASAKQKSPANAEVVSSLPEDPTEEQIVDLEAVKQYKDALSDLHNVGEDIHALNKYKQAAVNLLIGKKAVK